MTDIEELERRLARLEAVGEIERLKYRYLRACDAKDPDSMRECFVKDGAEIDYGPLGSFEGRDQLVDLYSHLALRREAGTWLYHDIHHGHHPDIVVTGEGTATGRWTLSFMRVNLEARVIEHASIEYLDSYALEDGAWRIRTSRVTPLTSFSVPLPDSARVAPGVPAEGKGSTGPGNSAAQAG